MCLVSKKKYNKALSELSDYKNSCMELNSMNEALVKNFKEYKAEKDSIESYYKLALSEKNKIIDNLFNKISVIEDKMEKILNNFNN